MSRYVFLRCETCDLSSGVDRNHGEDALRAVWRTLPAVKALLDHEANEHLGITVQADVFWHRGDPWRFLMGHEGHEVVLADEYGGRAPLDGDGDCARDDP